MEDQITYKEHYKNVLIRGIFMLLFLPVIAFTVADAAVPIDNNSSAERVIEHEIMGLNIQRISPNVMYGEAVGSLLDPMTRVVNPVLVTEDTSSRMLENPLSFGQSLLLVWPHITSLLAFSMVCFALSYVRFMREEIRSL
jgi:ABC-2 type transport system permease protein